MPGESFYIRLTQTGTPNPDIHFCLSKIYQCYAAFLLLKQVKHNEVTENCKKQKNFQKVKWQSTAAETLSSLTAYLHNITLKALPLDFALKLVFSKEAPQHCLSLSRTHTTLWVLGKQHRQPWLAICQSRCVYYIVTGRYLASELLFLH